MIITKGENIITRVREALKDKAAYNIAAADSKLQFYSTEKEPPEIIFARNFSAAGGIFIFAESVEDFTASLKEMMAELGIKILFCRDGSIKPVLAAGPVNFSDHEDDLTSADGAITLCENLVARTGSILVSAASGKGRKLHGLPVHHLVIGFTNQVVLNISDATNCITKKYPSGIPSMITLITGPSRTADIEKTLILGAHGPKNIIVFLLPERLHKYF